MTIKNCWHKLARLPKRVSTRLRERGLRDTLAWAVYQVAWRWHEWRWGINTDEHGYGVNLRDIGEYNGYEPTDYRCLPIVFNYLGADLSNTAFLDYGCGLGRVVIAAAQHPFRRVLGIEYSEELARLANQQISRIAPRLRCADVQVIHADAITYEVPCDVTAVFLLNSFTGAVLEGALKQLYASLEREPRELNLIYMFPHDYDDRLANIDWLEPVTELPTQKWSYFKCVVYQNIDFNPHHASNSSATTAANSWEVEV